MNSVLKSVAFAALPPLWNDDVLPAIRQELASTRRKLVVLDDDPTGTQTVHDIAVVTRWDVATLRAELEASAAGFYVLTNSRSLTASAARELNLTIAQNLREAALGAAVEFTLASRSDSTLRGHFPTETDALFESAGPFDATLIAPYFEAGGRYTIGDVHYVTQGEELVPAAQTQFARDTVFAYRESNLRQWIEEKTLGRVPAANVQTISLETIRRGGPDAVLRELLAIPRGAFVAVNAAAPRDIEVVALATLRAEALGRTHLFRTAASLVAARLGIALQSSLDMGRLGVGPRETGGLIVAGSHVPMTTEQLSRLRASHPVHAIELDVQTLLEPVQGSEVTARIARELDAATIAGKDALLFTSRKLVSRETAAANLEIGETVSNALIAVVRALTVRPRFLIAKGGITSSDVATKGLGVRRAVVLGQLIPGVPVWQLGAEAKYPGLSYVVFPGNVGQPHSLTEAVTRFAV